MTLAIYAIKRLFHFKQTRSTPKKVLCVCVDPKCDFYVFAAAIRNSDYFEIRKAVLEHKCDIMSHAQYNKHATTKVISKLMKSKYAHGTSGPHARDLPEILLHELHVTGSYWKAWRVRELALDLTQGSADGSYGLLSVYIHLLEKSNPGSLCKLESVDLRNGTRRFKYFFVSMRGSMEGIKYLRPVVVVDK